MFLDQPDMNFTLKEWENYRDVYLAKSLQPGLSESLAGTYKKRARFAAENVRRVTREIMDLELLWALPECEWRF